MKINRKELLGAINKVLPGIAVGNITVENADTIVFTNGHVYSYNSAISVDAKLPEGVDFKGVVKGQDFYNCINKLPGDEIELEVTESTWEITDDKIKISIKLLPDENLMERFESLTPTETGQILMVLISTSLSKSVQSVQTIHLMKEFISVVTRLFQQTNGLSTNTFQTIIIPNSILAIRPFRSL